MYVTCTGTHSWSGQSDISGDRREAEARDWMGLQRASVSEATSFPEQSHRGPRWQWGLHLADALSDCQVGTCGGACLFLHRKLSGYLTVSC